MERASAQVEPGTAAALTPAAEVAGARALTPGLDLGRLTARGLSPQSVQALSAAIGNRAVARLVTDGRTLQRSPMSMPVLQDSAPTKTDPTTRGTPVGKYARVGHVSPYLSVRGEMDDRKVTALPDPLVLATLDYNDRVLVIDEYPNDWVRVRTDNGTVGFTWSKKLFIGAPDPEARLHKTEPGETALGIAQRFYDCGGWGQDGRFFVNVLVAVNKAAGDRGRKKGIYKTEGDEDDIDSWKDTQLLSGFYIWIPGDEFARSLAGSVSSGSTTYELWQGLKGLAGFVVGVLDGIATTLVDLVMDIVDLASMLIDLIVDIAKKGFTAKVREIREFLDSLDPEEIAATLWHDFVDRWNAADAWDRWKFRGLVTGMVLAEIALAVLTDGATLALKAAGKGGKLAKLAAKLGKLDTVTDFANRVDNVGDATDAGRAARKVLKDERLPDFDDSDIDRAFDDVEHGRVKQEGDLVQGGRKGKADEIPDTAGGSAPGQNVPRELIAKTAAVRGKRIADAPEAVKDAWTAARKHVLDRSGPLTERNYKRLYAKAQKEFWKRVRRNEDAADWFKDNGFTFLNTKTGAPTIDMPHTRKQRKEFAIELDHITPKGHDWSKALDGDNLRFITGWDNWLLNEIERLLGFSG